MRLSLPSKDAVRTEATFTLNTASTATRISTLLASGRTLNATAFSSSFCRMLFSVMSGRIRISRGPREHRPELANHEQRRRTREAQRAELLHERLRPGALRDGQRLDDRELAARELRRDRRAQRLAAHGARHRLPVAPRRRAERLFPPPPPSPPARPPP